MHSDYTMRDKHFGLSCPLHEFLAEMQHKLHVKHVSVATKKGQQHQKRQHNVGNSHPWPSCCVHFSPLPNKTICVAIQHTLPIVLSSEFSGRTRNNPALLEFVGDCFHNFLSSVLSPTDDKFIQLSRIVSVKALLE
jgi:hypothetical protein